MKYPSIGRWLKKLISAPSTTGGQTNTETAVPSVEAGSLPDSASSIQVSRNQNDNEPSEKKSAPRGPIVTTAEAVGEDYGERVQKEVEKLSKRIDKESEKHRSEQRFIFGGVLLVIVALVASVVVEVLIFNAEFRDSLNTFEQQQTAENQTLQTNIQNEQASVNQELLNLKLSK